VIIFLMATAFDIHGTYTVFGFENSVIYHRIAAWALVGLWVFAIFWHLVTGEWRQYMPTTKNVVAMVKYYLSGIFKNAPHPHRQTEGRREPSRSGRRAGRVGQRPTSRRPWPLPARS
jgi:thiosulfate reductase cytochrome b subunit